MAADGGANALKRFGITPDVVVGDFDSILPSTKRRFSSTRFIHVQDQSRTDFEKALRFLVEERVTNVWVLGMDGGRIDFTLGNFASVWRYVPKLTLVFFGNDWTAFPVKGVLRLNAPVGRTVSLVPFGRCTGVTLNGFLYPLRNALLDRGSRGLSNLTTSAAPTLRLKRGELLAVVLGTPVF